MDIGGYFSVDTAKEMRWCILEQLRAWVVNHSSSHMLMSCLLHISLMSESPYKMILQPGLFRSINESDLSEFFFFFAFSQDWQMAGYCPGYREGAMVHSGSRSLKEPRLSAAASEPFLVERQSPCWATAPF